MGKPPDSATRDSGYTSDYEDLKPAGDGEAPRSRNEPGGSAGSEQSDKLLTDPGSGLGREGPQAPNQGPNQA